MSNLSDDGQHKQVQQVENISPLAVGDQKLVRHLGYFSGTMMNSKLFLTHFQAINLILVTVGQIIGTGIFSNPSYILNFCGSGGMMLIFWVIGAVFAGTGVWSYLELGTMVRRKKKKNSQYLFQI